MEEHIPAIIGGISAILLSFGAGVKWMLTRQDDHDARERAWQTEERAKLEAQFTERIKTLEDRLNRQETELDRTRVELRSHVRHVGVLEGLLKAHGIEAPSIQLEAGR